VAHVLAPDAKRGSRNKKQVHWNGPLVVDPSALAPGLDALRGMSAQDLVTCSPLAFLTHIYRNRGLATLVTALSDEQDAVKVATLHAALWASTRRLRALAVPGDQG